MILQLVLLLEKLFLLEQSLQAQVKADFGVCSSAGPSTNQTIGTSKAMDLREKKQLKQKNKLF